MQMPGETSSTEVLLGYGDFHLAALGADRATAEIAREFLAVHTALRTAHEARRAAERAELGAEAIRTGAEVETESDIRRLDLVLLADVKKERSRDPYKRILAEGLTGAITPKGRAQAVEGIRIADLVAPERGTPLAGVSGEASRIGTELRAKCANLKTAATAEDAAMAATIAALANEHQAKRRWREQYRKDHGLLKALFPDDRKVESFYKKASKGKKGRAPTDPVVSG